jgi:hypothetical protein
VLDRDKFDLGSYFSPSELVKSPDNIGDLAESMRNSRKRTSEEAFDPENNAGRAKQKAKKYAEKQEKLQFACPFQKLDPLRYHKCLKYALHRIKDVKQHVYRCHKQPDYYCARCFLVFETADKRDEHARSTGCENKNKSGFEGITEMEKKELNKSPSRGLDAQEQWFRMWDIIFPGETKPSSVLVGTYIEEMVPFLRSLWDRRNTKILAMAQRAQTRLVDPSLLDVVVHSIFDCLEAEASASVGEQRGEANSQIQQGVTGGQSPMLADGFSITQESLEVLYTEPQDFFQDIRNIQPEKSEVGGIVFGEG